jgi:hypothetical protein
VLFPSSCTQGLLALGPGDRKLLLARALFPSTQALSGGGQPVALGSLKDLSDSLCSYWPHLEASTTQKAWQGADSPCTGDQRSQAGLPAVADMQK